MGLYGDYPEILVYPAIITNNTNTQLISINRLAVYKQTQVDGHNKYQ